MLSPVHSPKLILHMLTTLVECRYANVGKRITNLKTTSILGSSYLNPRVIEGLMNFK
jgi:hypothetical protein